MEKSKDCVLGIRTLGCKMEGAVESTGLWRFLGAMISTLNINLFYSTGAYYGFIVTAKF